MNVSLNNFKYLSLPFKFKCSLEIFSKDERNLLLKYGYLFECFQKNKITPTSIDEIRFTAVLEKKISPFKDYEMVWMKLLARREWESKEKFSESYLIYNRSEAWFPRSYHWRNFVYD